MQIDYTKLSRTSVDKFQKLGMPEDVAYMRCGQTRGILIDHNRYIIVQKYGGSELKNAIRSGILHKMPNGYKLMIINAQREPLFLNKYKDIYFCNSMSELNSQGSIESPIDIIGSYEYVLHDKILKFSDKTTMKSEYYVIVSRGSNLYDGTRHFISTENLDCEEELEVREIQKRMISAIVDMYIKEKYTKKVDKKETVREEGVNNRTMTKFVFNKIIQFIIYTATIVFILYIIFI